MENAANHIALCGTLAGPPAFSHENHGRRFYRFPLEVERLSGASDTLEIVAAEEVLGAEALGDGGKVAVTGQIRSFNSRRDTGRRLVISVFASEVRLTDGESVNEAELTGTICKPPVYRRTPLGREICDLMLAVGRPYRRTDYLPCILWGRTAQEASRLPVGTRLRLTGRLQSREYVKLLDTGSEKRVAYEVSAVTAEAVPAESVPEAAPERGETPAAE